jgi:phage-related protein
MPPLAYLQSRNQYAPVAEQRQYRVYPLGSQGFALESTGSSTIGTCRSSFRLNGFRHGSKASLPTVDVLLIHIATRTQKGCYFFQSAGM